MKKTSLLIGVFALASLAFAGGKTYNVTLSKAAKVGSLQLVAGNYQLKVDGANAVFTEVETSKSFTTPVKVESTDKKFDTTQVNASKEGGTDVVKDIELGGSKTKLDFGM